MRWKPFWRSTKPSGIFVAEWRQSENIKNICEKNDRNILRSFFVHWMETDPFLYFFVKWIILSGRYKKRMWYSVGVYLQVLDTSFLLFPVIAFVILFPFLIVQYRKYGSIHFLRTLIFYSFILYCVCADFMTMLPLPTMHQLQHMAPVQPNLIPFGFFRLFSEKSGIIWPAPSTYWRALISPFTLQ